MIRRPAGTATPAPTPDPQRPASAEMVRVAQSVIGGSLDVRKGSLAEQVVDALMATQTDAHWIAHVESCRDCRDKYGDRPPLLGSE